MVLGIMQKLTVVCCHFLYRKPEHIRKSEEIRKHRGNQRLDWFKYLERIVSTHIHGFFILTVGKIWANTEIKREGRLRFKVLNTDS